MKSMLMKMRWALIVATLTGALHARWETTGGPAGGTISTIKTFGTTVVAVGACRPVYVSTDNGGTWSALASDIPGGGCQASFAVVNNGIIAGSYIPPGLYRIGDQGRHWIPIQSGLPDSTIYSIAGNDSIVFIATAQGIFRSLDAGSSWNAAMEEIPAGTIRQYSDLAIIDSCVFTGTPGGFFRSTDNGTTCTVLPVPNNETIEEFALNRTTLYARTYSGLYRSTDNGDSWVSITAGLPAGNGGPRRLALCGSTLFVIMNDFNLYRSTDNGASWTAVAVGPTTSYLTCLAANETTVFAGTRGAGIFQSVDFGESWTASGTGMNHIPVTSLATSGNDVFAGCDGGVFRRKNSDTTWSALDPGGTFEFTTAIAARDDALYVATNRGLYYSSDGGTVWKAPGDVLSLHSLAVNDSGCVATRTWSTDDYNTFQFHGSILFSENRGADWTDVLSGFSAQTTALVADGATVYAAGSLIHTNEGQYFGTIYRSDDNGRTWKQTAVTPPVISFAVIDDRLVAGTYATGAQQANCSIIVSPDSGFLWQPSNTGLPLRLSVHALHPHGRTLYAGTSEGIYLSDNRGTSWVKDTAGFPAGDTILSFTSSDSTLWAGTAHSGILRTIIPASLDTRKKPLTLAHSGGAWLKTTASSGAKTIIDIALPAPGHVTIAVYDLSGSKVATIADSYLQGGHQRLYWNTAALAAGCYTLRMETGSTLLTSTIPHLR